MIVHGIRGLQVNPLISLGAKRAPGLKEGAWAKPIPQETQDQICFSYLYEAADQTNGRLGLEKEVEKLLGGRGGDPKFLGNLGSVAFKD